MKDYKGFEIHRGCILRDMYEDYCRIVFVGTIRVIYAGRRLLLEEARKAEDSGYALSQEEIIKYQMTVVETRPLGVFDSLGKEYFVGCKVGDREVFDGVKSLNGDGKDIVLYKDDEFECGWRSYSAEKKAITYTPFEHSAIMSVKINGKKINMPVTNVEINFC